MPALAARHLRVGYRPARRPERAILADVTLSVRAGEFVCLLGPNGAGKSTLLRTLAGVQAPLAGSVSLGGRDAQTLSAAERAAQVAVVLTERVTPGLLSGWGLVALGRTPYTGFLGALRPDDERAVRQAVMAVDALELAARPVIELSDGERQRLMIARALAQESPVILLDEPTAFLDAPRRVEILTLLRDLAREAGRAVIASTHELHLALELADTLWLMDGRGAFHTGPPQECLENGAFDAAFPDLRRHLRPS